MYDDIDDGMGCIYITIPIVFTAMFFSYFCSESEKPMEVKGEVETMTFLASEIMGDYKVIYFDTDNDLSTAEKCDRMDLSDKNFLKIYNLKRGDVVKKSDWTKIVRRVQAENIRE